jgi:hypothetical protein
VTASSQISVTEDNTKFGFVGFAFYGQNRNFLSRAWVVGVDSFTAIAPEGTYYLRFFEQINVEFISKTPLAYQEAQQQLEFGPTATEYEEPGANQIEVSWQSEAGTIYGATLAINKDGSGELTVETAFHTVNGSESWEKTGSEHFFQYTRNIVTSRAMLMSNPNFLKHSCCNISPYKAVSVSNKEIGCCEFSSSNNARINYVRVRTSADMSLADFKQILSENPMQIVYMLYTPISYSLTSQQVITLLHGQNNIWADCGDVTAEYPADTKLYIQKINAPTDDDMIADTQIASGKYFLIGNTLYLSTTTIPAGDTIIPGTNCTQTDLAAALNALNT